MSSIVNPPQVGRVASWYSDRQSLSGDEQARIQGIDDILKPLDDPKWNYWPSWTEAIGNGKHGTEEELRSKPSGIAWSESRPMAEIYPQIPSNIQTTIKEIFPLKKVYSIGLIDRPLADTKRTSTCATIPLIYLLGNKDGRIPALSPAVRQAQEELPERGDAFRHIMFPLTKYDWLEKLPYMFSEACLSNLWNASPLLGFTEQGLYNAFLKPQVECQPRVGKPVRITISIPIIHVKDGRKLSDQKTAESCIRSLPSVIRAPGYEDYRTFKGADGKTNFKPPIWNWTHPLDDPESATPGEAMRIYSGRSLFEYRYPRQNTRPLDSRQTVRKHGIRGSPGLDNYLCVDQMWAVIFLKTDTLVTFQQLLSIDSATSVAGTNIHQFEPSRGVHITPNGPVHGFFLFFADMVLKSHYGIIDSFRDATADINFRVSSNPVEDGELIQDSNSLLTELSILTEVTSTQLEILAGVKNSMLDEELLRPEEFKTTTEFYSFLTDRLTIVQGTLKELQFDAKQAQNLLFQLLSTENAKQQAKMSTQQAEIAVQTAKETAIQVRMAERAEEQSKSVLVFTIITTVFLPLSFFTSYYGMDATSAGVSDANGFWRISGPASLIIVILAMALAFRSQLKRVLFRVLHFRMRVESTSGVDQLEYDPSKIEKGERDLTKNRTHWGWGGEQKKD